MSGIIPAPLMEKPQTRIERDKLSAIVKRYCHVIDPRDSTLLEHVHWPDAIDNHAIFRGTPAELIDFASPTEAFAECHFSANHDYPSKTSRMDRAAGKRTSRPCGPQKLDTHSTGGILPAPTHAGVGKPANIHRAGPKTWISISNSRMAFSKSSSTGRPSTRSASA